MQIGKGLCMSTPPPQQPFIKLSNTNDHHTGCLCNVKFLYVHFSLWSHTCTLSKKEKVKFGTGSLVSHLQRRLTVAQMFSQITVNVPTTDDTPVTRSYTLFCCRWSRRWLQQKPTGTTIGREHEKISQAARQSDCILPNVWSTGTECGYQVFRWIFSSLNKTVWCVYNEPKVPCKAAVLQIF